MTDESMGNPNALPVAEFGKGTKPWPYYKWSDLCMPGDLGSHIRFHFKGRGCVYRLVGLTEDGATTPVTLDRVCGHDPTGTLYIGCAGKPGRLRHS